MTTDTAAASGREMLVTHTIPAPREVVFRAFTEPKHLEAWWGPDGFSTTTHAFEFRVGGVWEYTMHGPDGTDYPNWSCYREIRPPELLAYEHGQRAGDPDAFETTITFEERDGATLITLRSLFKTKARLDEVIRRFNAEVGAHEHVRRLADYCLRTHPR